MTSPTKSASAANNLGAKLNALPPTMTVGLAGILVLLSGYEILVDGARFAGLVLVLAALGFAMLGFAGIMRDMKRVKRLERIRTAQQVADMDHYEVAALVTTLYELDGYVVAAADEADRKQADVDLIATKAKEKVLIRCREWEESSVKLDAVRRFKASLSGLGGTKAVFYANGGLAADAIQYAAARGVERHGAGEILATVIFLTTGAPPSKTDVPGDDAGNAGDVRAQEAPASALPRREVSRGFAARPARILFVDPDAVVRGGDILAQVLHQHPDLSVVVSSDRAGGVDRVRAALADRASAVIGTTPESAGSSHARYAEIQRYLLESAAPDAVWVAIDTCPQQFPEATVELLQVARERGFTHGAASRLGDILRAAESRLALRRLAPRAA